MTSDDASTFCTRRWIVLDAIILFCVAAVLATMANKIVPAEIQLSEHINSGSLAQDRIRELGFETVNLAQAKQIVAAGDHLIFDARPTDSFVRGHLPSAMSLPSREADSRISEVLPLLVADQPVMVYCSGRSCDDSIDLAKLLQQQGMEKIMVFVDGYADWTGAGLEVEIGE